jgi:hypothetical protein
MSRNGPESNPLITQMDADIFLAERNRKKPKTESLSGIRITSEKSSSTGGHGKASGRIEKPNNILI